MLFNVRCLSSRDGACQNATSSQLVWAVLWVAQLCSCTTQVLLEYSSLRLLQLQESLHQNAILHRCVDSLPPCSDHRHPIQ